MSLHAVLALLAEHNIRLSLENEQLKVNAAKGAVTPEILSQLKAHKDELLAWVKQAQAKQQAQQSIAPRPESPTAPLSFAQQRLWFIDQLAPGNVTYNLPAALVLRGDVNVDVLQAVVDQLVQRHEALRTRFIDSDGEAEQVIDNDTQLTIVQESCDLSLDEQEALLAKAQQFLLLPFDLRQAPLCRIHLLQLRSVEEKPVYLLLFALHHIITDGWSNGVLMADIAALYQAISQGERAALSPLTIQYADYAYWQQEQLPPAVLAEKTQYWQAQLRDLEALELPTDFPRPAQKSGRGQTLHFTLPASLQQSVQSLSTQLQCTPFVVLLAAWQALLHRYTGSEDICTGSPIAGRNRAELQNVVGFFVNTLALRNDLSGQPSFAQLVKQVQKTLLDATDHQDVPFESVVDALGIPRDMSSTPVFQNAFSYQKGSAETHFNLGDLSIEALSVDTGTAKFDITLGITDNDEDFVCSLEYDSDIFLHSRIERMAQHFENLLSQACAQVDRPISHIDYLTAKEQQLLTQEWCGHSAPFVKDIHLATQIERWAIETPEQTAIEYQGQTLSYAEFDAQASQLAHYLVSKGFSKGDYLAIAIQRSPAMLISLFACLKAGGAYIPVDPEYPEDRIRHMLDDSKPRFVMSLPAQRDKTQAFTAIEVLDFEQAQAEASTCSSEWRTPSDNNQGEDLAYIMYTSGSTGLPKGVVMPQRGPCRMVLNTNYTDLQPGQRVAHMCNIAFDATALEIWTALLNGCTLQIISQDVVLDPAAFEQTISAQPPHVLIMPPALFNIYVSHNADMFAKVRHLICGGEAMDIHRVRDVLKAKKPLHLINGYGPTENSCISTFYDIQDLPEDATNVPLGISVSNNHCYILDKHHQLVPVGVAGELCVSGDGLALGYLNQPEQSAEVFIASPFANSPSITLYRTGDICRWREDGLIEMLGRADDQVKLRGYRIELGEINQQLGALDSVSDAAVIVHKNAVGNAYLAAYIVADKAIADEQAFFQALRSQLAQHLPQYMLPQAWSLIDKLPLTANGKIDRRALPEPQFNLSTEQAYVAPRNTTEQSIAEIWQEILQQDDISVHANFFEIGGHSLLATRVIARLRDQFAIDIAIRELFDNPSIAELALRLQLLQASGSQLPALEAQSRPEHIPLSFAQQRLWFIDKLSPNDATYNMPFALRLSAELDVPALQQAYLALLQRHESLRTQIFSDKGLAYQRIIAADELEAADILLPLTRVDQDDKAIERRALAFIFAPFTLEHAPLIRAQLLQQSSKDDYVFLLSMHHIISDGWSMDILVRDLMALYAHYALSAPLQLPQLNVHYADYSLWQKQYLQGDVLEQQIDFWREQLQGAAPTDLPLDFARPAQLNNQGAQVALTLSGTLSNKLRKLAQEQESTLFMLGLAAFSLLMGRYSNQQDISIGTPVANRTQQALQDMIGMFVNTLVMRNQWDNSQSFSALLKQVKQQSLAAFQYQDVPFELLVDELHIPRDLSQTPLFNVMFILQASSQQQHFDIALPGGLSASALFEENTQTTAKFDLTLNMVDTEQLGLVVEYRTSLFKQESIERLLNHFVSLLEAVCEQPQAAVSQLRFISDEEQTLLDTWYQADKEPAPYQSISAQIQAQAAKTPDAIASVCGEQILTYQQLDAQSGRLAEILVEHGVKIGDRVGVCLHKRVEVLVALLACIKAGACYVPMDASYPSERLNYMFSDADMALVLSESRLKDQLTIEQNRLLFIDQQDLSAIPAMQPVDNAADDLLYMIYTSGSTGLPKAAAVYHKSFANLLHWYGEEYLLHAADKTLIISALGFDLTQKNLFALLCCGGTIVFPDSEHYDPTLYRSLIAEQQITILNCAPSAFYPLLEKRDTFNEFATLRQLLFGGESIQLSNLQPWIQSSGFNCSLGNMYGPTECTDIALAYNIRAEELIRWPSEQSIPLGKACSGVSLYILDDALQPVAPNTLGQLYIAGISVGAGYWQRDELNQEHFLPNPYSKTANDSTLYKTGDYVRLMNDAKGDWQLIYQGRADFQVKLRGLRIELSEIEQAINRLDTVIDSFVLVEDEQLIGFVRCQSFPSAWREKLQQQLPDYMMPAVLVAVDEWPLTAHGKIDRNALPKPKLESSVEYIAPRNDLEKLIHDSWQSVLPAEKIGINDNFFELGGHSLLAVRVLADIDQKLDINLPVRVLFTSPTIAQLAQAIAQDENKLRLPPITIADRSQPLPLSFAQQRFWFIEQLNPNDSTYNMPFALRINEALDPHALQQAYSALIQRHESLRSRIISDKGQAIQAFDHIDDDANLLPLITFNEGDKALERHINQFLFQAFDLAKGPLIRAQLIQEEDSTDYLFLLAIHHIISDGWSMDILVRDLMALYAHYALGAPLSLPTLNVQYADYSVWQQAYLQGEVLQQQVDFWRKELEGTESLDLPLDYARPAQLDNQGAKVSLPLSAALSQKLRTFSQAEGSSLFMLGLAAFSLLMGRYSNQTDVSIGTPVANRGQQALHDLIGLFLNTLVMRNQWDNSQSFRDFLQQVKQHSLTALQHQDIPFELLVDELNVPRDLSQTPLFNVFFILQTSSQESQYNLDLPSGLDIRPLNEGMEQTTAKFDLTLNIIDSDEITLTAEYRTSLFKQSSIERLLEHYILLLESICQAPDTPVGQLQFIREEEKQQIAQWNQTDYAFPVYAALQQPIEEQVERTPDAIAVADHHTALSYRELDTQANQLAHYLISQGVKQNQPVGVCLYRGVDMSIALLAVLKAGAAYVPFDPDFPADRLQFMAGDTATPLIISSTDVAVAQELTDVPLLLMQDRAQWQHLATDKPAIAHHSEQLFNIIYTSGSTGNPKGVVVPHRGIINRLQCMQLQYPIDGKDTLLQKTPYSFDVSVWELFWPLMQGARIFYAKPDGHKEPSYLRDVIIEENITLIHFVPSMLGAFLQTPGVEDCHSIRLAYVSGEAVQIEHCRQFYRRLPNAQLHNHYGPTEASIEVTYYHCVADEPHRSVPIGKALPNLQLWILDSELNLVPPGINGDLYIGGIGVAYGYLNLPELTAEVFIPSPFAEGETLYKTGDVACFLDDGNIEYIGRSDHQIKIRGLRIELGEIESQLQKTANVREAIVSAWSADGSADNQQLVAYLLADEDFDTVQLRKQLAEYLPDYMLPSYFITLDAWPLGSSGKIDRKALPKPTLESSEEYIAPRNKLEELIHQSWQAVLPAEKIGINDNFFELGGHSLLAVRVLADINQKLAINLPVRVLFASSTIAQLAEAIEQDKSASSLPPITLIADREQALPLSFAQQRLWFIDILSPNDATYNMPFALRLSAELDVAALQQAYLALLQRHESLRTQIFSDKGLAYQRIIAVDELDAADILLPLARVDADDKAVEKRALSFIFAPFTLEHAPLIRAQLLQQTDKDDYVFLLSMHHIISDGWSMDILVRDLMALYAHYAFSAPLNLPALDVHYADYSLWQKQYLQGDVLEQQIDFWREQLQGAAPIDLPLDYARPAQLDNQGAQFALTLSAEQSRTLREFAQAQGSTLFMLGLAAFSLLMGRYSNQSDISIGTPVANRPQQALQDMIGLFVNTLVMRSTWDSAQSFSELLEQVKQQSLAAMQHQDIPFELLIDELNIPRDLSQTPLFNVMFVSQASSQEQGFNLDLPGGISASSLFAESTQNTAKFDLTLNLVDAENIMLVMEYRTALFKQESIERLLNHFVNLLEAICETPDLAVAKLALIKDEKQQAIEKAWPFDSALTDNEQPFIKAFEQQAEKAPDAIAVISGNTSLSYQALNTQANQLAHHLLELGAAREQVIAISLDRSPLLLVGLLAVMKTGAAYVPIDPTLPQERIAYILQDSQALLMLTQSKYQNANLTTAQLCIDQSAVFNKQKQSNPDTHIAPDDLVYVLYTSGSTGNPKGVMIEQSGLYNYLSFASECYMPVLSGSVVSSTISFDATITSLYTPFLNGKSVTLTPAEDEDFNALAALIFQSDTNYLFKITPAHLEYLHSRYGHEKQSLSEHVFVIGGEQLLNSQLIPWLDKLAPNARYINEYGPTETVVGCCILDVSQNRYDYRDKAAAPIGLPISNTTLFILDAEQQAVPTGVIGELYIAGAGVARGYLNLEDQTAENFLFNENGTPYYRTGDLVRKLDDGNIEYLGRADNQVKIRGFRIELDEIESQLKKMTGIQDAAVLVQQSNDDKRLVAFYIAEKEHAIDGDALRQALKPVLPEYMLPAAFVAIDTMPLTSNGKRDNKALLAIEVNFAGQHYAPPSTALQHQLVDTWQRYLPVAQVGIHDNFFDIGGHSILAVRVLADIGQTLNITIPVRLLFEHPTIAQLAIAIEQQEHHAALPPIGARPEAEFAPLTFAQQRLWFLAQLDPHSIAYNMPTALRIKGNLNIAALEQAFDDLFARHEILRTSIINHGGDAQLYIQEHSDFSLQFEQAANEERLEQAINQHAHASFDLAEDSLLKASLVDCGDKEYVLLLNIHHIISDGLSIQILIRDLASLYMQHAQQIHIPLPTLPVQYADYAYWQRNWLQGDVLQQQIDFWKEELKGAPALLPLPLDKPRPPVQRFVGAEIHVPIDQNLANKIRQLSSQQGCTLFMSLMAAYQVLLAKYSRHDDICIGIPLAGRSLPETEHLIGFFINALVIRGDLSANYSLAELLQQVKQKALAAYAHEHIPVEMMINELGIERSLAYTPLVQCAFNMMTMDPSTLPEGLNQLDDLSLELIKTESVVARFDVQFNVMDISDELHFSIDYNSDIFNADTIHTMGQHYLHILQCFADNMDTRLYEVQLGELAVPADYSKALPLTLMQRDIYLASLARPDTRENSLGYTVEIPFAIDEPLWRNALELMTQQCDILRADVMSNTTPWQDLAYFAIREDRSIDYAYVDWSHEKLSPSALKQRLDGLVSRPYDVKQNIAPSYRLIKVADNHHYMTMAAHHMILDGYALAIQLQRHIALYQQLLEKPQQTISLANNAADYVIENQQRFDLPETLHYWREQCQDLTALQVEKGQQNAQQLLSLELPKAHISAVKDYCRKNRITPALYFKTLYLWLVAQYAQADGNFAITEFHAGRSKAYRDSLGCFYHTYPCIAELGSFSGAITDAIKALREQQRDNKDYLNISHMQQTQLIPAADVQFSYNYLQMQQHIDWGDSTLPAVRYTPNAHAMVDFRVQADGDALSLSLALNSAVFAENNFLQRLLHISQQIAEQGQQQFNGLSLLLDSEQQVITAAAKPASLLLNDAFALQAEKTPLATAVQCGDKQLSYADLDRQSNALANTLIDLGVKTGDRIGICMHRRVEMFVALLAIIKSGACYVPMDASYPAERLNYMLQDADMQWIISESCLLDRLADNSERVLDIDSLDCSKASIDAPKVAISGDDILYMIYTSGSTGLPKAAQVYQQSFANLLAWYIEEYQLSASDKALIISAFGFDLTQKNLFALLCCGGTVVLPESDYYDVEHYRRTIWQQEISILNCAPSAFYPMVELATDEQLNNLASLRLLLFGGESINLNNLQHWIQSPSFKASLVNMYGPTECTDIATAFSLTAEEVQQWPSDKAIPIGQPIPGVSLYVLNEQLQAVPQGLPGELYIAGSSVGAGYWQRPEMNTESFIKNPYSQNNSDTILYKTGDRVIRKNDDLFYLGRKDFQVKLNGLRIELGEIEQAIKQLDDDIDSYVLVDNEQLLAFVRCEEIPNNAIATLQAQLPAYMLPKSLIRVDSWPLNAHGKIDRTALLALDRPSESTTSIAPRTETEQQLAALWQEVLGDSVGIHDNFFGAGGDSIAAVRLVTRIELFFSIKIPVSSLFNAQTIAQLALLIDQETGAWSPIVPIQPQGHKTPIFAVHAIGAMVMSYKDLAQSLGTEQPFYGIQALGFEEGQEPFTALNEMVAYYTAAIKQQQPEGPYRLIGHSFGGLIAAEIARQLLAIGDEVEQLVLIDTHMPVKYMDNFADDAAMLKAFAEHNFGVVDVPLRVLRKLPQDKMIDIVAEQFKGTVSADFIHSAINIIKGFRQMMLGYIPDALPLPITLIRPEQNNNGAGRRVFNFMIGQDAKTLGWKKVSPEVDVQYVAGDHHSMLQGENAGAVAIAIAYSSRGK